MNLKKILNFFYRKIPFLKNLIIQRDILLKERDNLKKMIKQQIKLEKNQVYPAGHFYSPIPSLESIKKYYYYSKKTNKVYGINLNEQKQLFYLKKISKYYKFLPFEENKIKKLRYFYINNNFSYGDAISLYLMIMFLKPKKIVEIGSGFSSCVALDTNELFFNNKIELTFIEPYPDLFLSLLKKNDLKSKNNQLIKKNLQDVNLNIFKKLNKNDILFIDSTHVSKFGSDVNYIFFNILPNIKKRGGCSLS